MSEDGKEGYLILEWLDASDWKMCDITIGCQNIQTAQQVAGAIGRVHGISWNESLVSSNPWLPPLNEPLAKHVYPFLSHMIPKCLTNLQDCISQVIKEKIEKVTAEHLSELLDECAQPAKIIIHNDVKVHHFLIEIMFEYFSKQTFTIYPRWRICF